MQNANFNVTLVSADTCLTSQQEKHRTPLRKSQLINSLNSINFHDGTINLQFKHLKYQSVVTLSATPQVCDDETLECTWLEPVKVAQKLKSYAFDGFYISDGLKKIQVDAEMLEMTDEGARLVLPQTCYELESRTIKRHRCQGIAAQISQNGAVLEGRLINFSALFFSITIQPKASCRRPQLDTANPVNIVLRDDRIFCSPAVVKLFARPAIVTAIPLYSARSTTKYKDSNLKKSAVNGLNYRRFRISSSRIPLPAKKPKPLWPCSISPAAALRSRKTRIMPFCYRE
ncbi:MAG: hypothetical protein GXP57_00580 [Deltaproteobacteria bacterium]|nr:hypothetical protein [Deltaproteobacteria bacterium]